MIGELTGGWIGFARGLDVFRGRVRVSIVSGGYSAEPVIALVCALLPICPDKAIKHVDRCFSMNIYTGSFTFLMQLVNRLKDFLT